MQRAHNWGQEDTDLIDGFHEKGIFLVRFEVDDYLYYQRQTERKFPCFRQMSFWNRYETQKQRLLTLKNDS